ncbi:MAG: adenylate/guanylate cyclase domain-containing protein [Candidatus Methanoperedens sp.]|nr:adenylate/guanylate cyclase domain-containing protein [Candidatus Methanoperedens sp.]MCZ7404091.1 adenylate/guanylate cyclase domain-containing protein [Candidatus Methanoperedens sp.]
MMGFNSDTYYPISKERIILYDKDRRQSSPVNGRTMPKLEQLSIGEARKFQLSILSVDIVDFTKLVMSYNHKEMESLRRIQSNYLTEMTYIINDHDGVTEKYTGDGILGMFGTESSDDLKTAVQNSIDCACTIKAVFKNVLNPYLEKENLSTLNYRIGIDCGPVIIERVGMKGNNQLSLSGPSVNLAAKLSKLADSNSILIGRDIYNILLDGEKKYCRTVEKKWDYGYPYYNYTATWSGQ